MSGAAREDGMRATNALVLLAALVAGGIGYQLGQARGAPPPTMERESQGAPSGGPDGAPLVAETTVRVRLAEAPGT
jgi:hypothetical protein